MRIIEPGRHNPFIKTCTCCGCKFQWARRDVKVTTDDGYGDPYHYVPCPECETSIEVVLPAAPSTDRAEWMDL